MLECRPHRTWPTATSSWSGAPTRPCRHPHLAPLHRARARARGPGRGRRSPAHAGRDRAIATSPCSRGPSGPGHGRRRGARATGRRRPGVRRRARRGGRRVPRRLRRVDRRASRRGCAAGARGHRPASSTTSSGPMRRCCGSAGAWSATATAARRTGRPVRCGCWPGTSASGLRGRRVDQPGRGPDRRRRAQRRARRRRLPNRRIVNMNRFGRVLGGEGGPGRRPLRPGLQPGGVGPRPARVSTGPGAGGPVHRGPRPGDDRHRPLSPTSCCRPRPASRSTNRRRLRRVTWCRIPGRDPAGRREPAQQPGGPRPGRPPRPGRARPSTPARRACGS